MPGAGGFPHPTGGNNASDQYHSDRSLYENSDYPPRRHPSREAEHTHEDRRAAPRRRRSRRPRRAHGRLSFILGTLLLVFLCTGAILCCFAAVYVKTVIFPMADLSLDDFTLGQNSVMYYTDPDTGEDKELVTLLSDTSSIWVDYDDIPQDLINAAVAIEDKRFWDHSGVDWRRTSKAVLDMFTGGDISGGSTITQQLIKHLTENNSKEDTITWYLNVIPLGSRCEGVGSAAYTYFGKSVSELDLAECASLISITNNPSRYGPYSLARVKY